MNRSKQIILIGVIVVGGMLAYYRNRPSEQQAPTVNVPTRQDGTNSNWPTKSDDQAAVNVTVTPLELSPQAKEWKFDVGMNTHSVTLDQDMLKVAILLDDRGNEYKPLLWEGDPAGGHHREGVLVFSSIISAPKSVELKISGIGGVERSFIWRL